MMPQNSYIPPMNILAKLGFTPARWSNDHLIILDQRRLPIQEEYAAIRTVSEAAEAIASLAVRGAPLIGIVAAYGLCLVDDVYDTGTFENAAKLLAATRPTAVNLAWAIDRMLLTRNQNIDNPSRRKLLIEEAGQIHSEDAAMCDNIGEIGNAIVPDTANILTHCNAGALATGGIGTALGVIYTAHFSGKKIHVWVDETRPVLQGARLTAWELSKAGVPYTIISDNMAGSLMAQGKIDLVITGADRVAANHDFANKIGTYPLAVLAHYHGIPFYAAAPSSTFDPRCPNGASIIIEERDPNEILQIDAVRVAPVGSKAFNPSFDITPHALISGIITEKGILKGNPPPD
jgi:methylthioribose-1-phosphate isomerase